MEINFWTQRLHGIYTSAVEQYRDGKRGADTFFSEEETDFLASIGLRPIHLYDYAEDINKGDQPDWETVLLMVSARRDYFIHEMQRQWNVPAIQESDLPSKDDAFEGIGWLPRILPKALAYLQGALPEEIMYCCGGDRKFFKAVGAHPADFLRVVWAAHGKIETVAKYLKPSPPRTTAEVENHAPGAEKTPFH